MRKEAGILLEILKGIEETQELLKEVGKDWDINVYRISGRLEEARKEILDQLKNLIWAEFCTKHNIRT